MLQRKLDGLVRQNRFTIAVVFPLMGAVGLIASAESFITGFLQFNPYLILFGVLVMRLPLISGILPLIGRRELTGLTLLCIYSYFIEFIGVSTGLPYGEFRYLIELGPMIAGKIPLGLPIFFLPLVFNSYLLTVLLLDEKAGKIHYRLPAVISTVLFLDLILDPAAVAVQFWEYEAGIYYGVPLLNYLGWTLSATVTVLILDRSFELSGIRERLESCKYMLDDMVSFAILWTLVSLYYQLWIPAVLGTLLGYTLYSNDRFNIPKP